MCASLDSDSDLPDWLQALMRWTWGHREQLVVPVAGGGLVLLVGILLYLVVAPSDLDRAEADRVRAVDVVKRLRSDSQECEDKAAAAATDVAEMRAEIQQRRSSNDTAWLRYREALCDVAESRQAEYSRRRDALLVLVAEYLPLVAEAKREILRAETARDRGHPVRIAPRVRDILAPILTGR